MSACCTFTELATARALAGRFLEAAGAPGGALPEERQALKGTRARRSGPPGASWRSISIGRWHAAGALPKPRRRPGRLSPRRRRSPASRRRRSSACRTRACSSALRPWAWAARAPIIVSGYPRPTWRRSAAECVGAVELRLSEAEPSGASRFMHGRARRQFRRSETSAWRSAPTTIRHRTSTRSGATAPARRSA